MASPGTERRGRRARVRDYLDIARTLIVALDPGGRVTLVNRFGCEVLEGRESEIVGRSWFETFLFPEDVAEVRDVFERILRGEISGLEDYENPIRTLRGERREFLWHNAVLQGSDGRVVEVLSSGEDLTERNRAARALRESDARRRALLEALPDLMFRLSRAGVHLDFHAPTQGELLLAPEAFMGRSVSEVLPPEVAETYLDRIAATLDSGRLRRFEYDLSFPDRGRRSYEARMVVSGDDEVLVVVHDITARKRLEQQVRQSQKMEALGQLAAGVAHDFNNILTAILGNAQLASCALPSGAPDVLAEALEQIEQSARSAAGLTKRLLGFTRQKAIEPASLDLAAILARMMAVLRRLIGENVELSLSASRDLRRIRADVGQIEQVVINLVVNARDAIAGHGRIDIRIENRDLEPARHEWPGAPPGEYVLLSVEDDGRGMDEATASRVFEPFFTTKPPGEGTGLGLSTVYGTVRHCGGQVHVSSAPGAGAEFRVLLPADSSHQAEVASPPPRPSPGQEATILVCEDDAAVRRLMVQALEGAGYVVLEAAEGPGALRKAGEHPAGVDVLVTDVIMPRMNGRELSEALGRSQPRLRTLFVSGYASDLLTPRDAEALVFLQKPFTGDDLLARVAELLASGAP